MTEKSPEEAEVKADEHDHSMFSSPDSKLHDLNISLELIGGTSIKKVAWKATLLTLKRRNRK